MHFAYFQLRVAKQYQIQNVSQLFIETYFCDVDTVCTLASVWLWNFFDGGSKKASQNSTYRIVASRSTSQLVTPHVTN